MADPMNDWRAQVGGFLGGHYAVLAGAGISYGPPSSLPTASSLLHGLLDSPLLPLPERCRATLKDATSPEWSLGVGRNHFLRFELFVEAMAMTVDADLRILRSQVESSAPGHYHHLLAELRSLGHPILTTNFDTLIEQACEQRGVGHSTVITEDDYERYSADPRGFSAPVFKLHGSLTSAAGLAGTLSRVAHEYSYSPGKWRVIDSILENHDLLVIGYSGYDDFDVMPLIGAVGKPRRLLWIDHRQADQVKTYAGLEGRTSLSEISSNEKLAGFFGMTFSTAMGSPRVRRDANDVIVVQGDTREVLEVVCPIQASSSRSVPKSSASPPRDLHLFAETTGGSRQVLSARLLQTIGLNHPAAKFYERAIQFMDPARSPELWVRANLWLKDVYLSRAKVALAEECELRTVAYLDAHGFRNPTFEDRLLFSDLIYADHVASPFLRSVAGDLWMSKDRSGPALKQMLTIEINGLLRAVQVALARSDYRRAASLLESCRRHEMSVSPLTRARVWYWRACLHSMKRSDEFSPEAWWQLDEAAWIFSQNHDYRGWASALILQAEGSTDAEGKLLLATAAHNICLLIAYVDGAMFAARLMAEALDDSFGMSVATADGKSWEPSELNAYASTLEHRMQETENLTDDEMCSDDDCIFHGMLFTAED